MKQLGTGAGRLIMRGFPYGIGSAYRSQTHKVFQTSCQLMSGGCMRTSNVESTHQECCLVRPVAERISIAGVVDHLQGALFNLELFGPGCAAIVISSLFVLISFLHQWAHSGAQKGVI
jgi:hypothetical protein